MPISWIVPQADRVLPPVVDPTELGGEDAAIYNSDHILTPAGALQTVSRQSAARQSVLREASANPGSCVRLPSWGYGLPALLFKNQTKASRGEVESATRAGLKRNRRIKNISEVSTQQTSKGVILTIRADSTDGPIEAQLSINPESRK